MIEFLTRNLWWKLFALLIAVLLWIAVANEPELSTFLSVPVEFRDLSEEIEISSRVVEKVELELRGPSGELRNFMAGHTAVVLDMSDAKVGENTYTLGEGNVHLPRGLRLIRVIPPALRFVFERHVEKTVPVSVQFAGKPERYEVSPTTMTIAGPESKVKQISFVTTDKIDVNGLSGSKEFRVSTFAGGDAHVRIASDPQVTVQVWMTRELTPAK